jgi:hypothetical protein
MERLARVRVPNNGSFALVGDAHGFDIGYLVPLVDELLSSLLYAVMNGGDNLPRVMLVPSANIV